MSDKDDSISRKDIAADPIESLTPNEFQQHLNNYGLEKPCPDCGQVAWDMLVDFDDKMMVYTLPDTHLNRFVGRYILECNVCGHSKFYSTRIVNPKFGKRHGAS